MISRFKADPRRVYVVGFSLGGLFVGDIAVHLSHRVAACCNWCGGVTAPKSWMNDEQRKLIEELQPQFHLAERKPPIYLLTCEYDTNLDMCLLAKAEYEKRNWPLKYEWQAGIGLIYLDVQTNRQPRLREK